MKKIFTLLAALFVISTAWAQETDNTFQFTDLEGNPVADGTVIVINTPNEEGQMVVPLKVRNISGEKAAVSLFENIDDMPNGSSFEYVDTKSYGSDEPIVRAVTATVTGGLYEGTVEYDYRDKGIKLYGQYTDGHPEVLDYETPNGDTAFVIAYSEDKNAWLTNMWGSAATSGIRGMD